MTTALLAPSNDDQSLTAVPASSTNTPCDEANSEPSALKVVRVNTDLPTFFTGDGWATVVKVASKSRPVMRIPRVD